MRHKDSISTFHTTSPKRRSPSATGAFAVNATVCSSVGIRDDASTVAAIKAKKFFRLRFDAQPPGSARQAREVALLQKLQPHELRSLRRTLHRREGPQQSYHRP